MGRSGITQQEVFDAASHLRKSGGTVTVKTIREYLGDKGSYSTISRHLREWEAARGLDGERDHTPPASLERDALRFVRSLWKALLGALQRDRNHAEAAARQLKRLDTEIHQSQASIRSVEHQCADQALRLEHLTEELAEKERELRHMERELAASELRLRKLQQQEAELEGRIGHLSPHRPES